MDENNIKDRIKSASEKINKLLMENLNDIYDSIIYHQLFIQVSEKMIEEILEGCKNDEARMKVQLLRKYVIHSIELRPTKIN